jgi:hypothetical protein
MPISLNTTVQLTSESYAFWDMSVHMISGFRREVDENCALLGYYAARSGNLLPTFRDNLSGPIFKGSLKMGSIGCTETSVRNYYSLRNGLEERSSYIAV